MAETKTPSLASQLCFDLYAASRAMTNAYRPAMTEIGLTYPQYLVMIVLWEKDVRTVREIADELMLDHGTLTPLLRRMETNGMISRQRSASDERFVEIALTPHGDALRKHATPIQCDMVAALGFDQDEFAELQETLRSITARLTL